MNRKPLTLVKVGGAIVEDDAQLALLLRHFAALPGRKLLVHGGGRRATALAARLGIESRLVGGRRITDAETLNVVTMVYAGLVNKSLVARLEALGTRAVGLTGADLDCIRSHRRPPVVLRQDDNEARTVDFGFVGDVDHVASDRLSQLVESGVAPVLAPLTHDGRGQLLNTNADTIASEVAVALADCGYDVTLVYCFEQAGVLDATGSVVSLITPDVFRQLSADGTISGGMLPKVENALAATRAGVGAVFITHASDLTARQGTRIMSPTEAPA